MKFGGEREWGYYNVSIKPKIELIKPLPETVYFFNMRICYDWLDLLTVHNYIFGKITIIADTVEDNTGIDRIEFYVDDELRKEDTSAPYSCVWRDRIFTRYSVHYIGIVAYNNDGNMGNKRFKVWKYF